MKLYHPFKLQTPTDPYWNSIVSQSQSLLRPSFAQYLSVFRVKN